MSLLSLPTELVSLVAARLELEALSRWESTAKALPHSDADWVAAVVGRVKQRMPATLRDEQWAALFGLSQQTTRRELQGLIRALMGWNLPTVDDFIKVVRVLSDGDDDAPDRLVKLVRANPRLLVQTRFDRVAPMLTNHFTMITVRDAYTSVAVVHPNRQRNLHRGWRPCPANSVVDIYYGLNTDAVPVVALQDVIAASSADSAVYKRFVGV